jgi:hypothetical protein
MGISGFLGRWRRCFLFIGLAGGVANSPGQYFFPDSKDYAFYDRRTPGTPAGRLYVGDLSGKARCHFRIDLPAGKTLGRIAIAYSLTFNADEGEDGAKVRVPAVFWADGSGKLKYLIRGQFQQVDKDGKPCSEHFPASLAAAPGTGVAAISVSNDADSFDLACNGRYAVVAGSGRGGTPVALVDLRNQMEVDKFAFNATGTFAAACDDGQSVLALLQVFVSAFETRPAIRRLTITQAGKLNDTEEVFSLANPEDEILKVFAVPGSRVGLAVIRASGGANPGPRLVSFSIPGLTSIDSARIFSGGEVSVAVACEGDKVFVRSGDRIEGFSLDPATGALGDAAFLTIPGVTVAFLQTFYGNALGISEDGSRLVVSEPVESQIPGGPQSLITFFDTISGLRAGAAEVGALANPTLVASSSCCGGPELELAIDRLSSGLIRIASYGEVGKRYELQRSGNLSTWEALIEFQVNTSPELFTDPQSPTNGTRFYRLRSVP